jgi:hypothetical protein
MSNFVPKNRQEWSREILTVLFGVFIIAQLVWLAMPNISTGFPSARTRQAIELHENDSESVQMAAIAEARRLDMIDYHRREVAKYTVLLGLDIVVVYLFWKYGNRYTAA